MMHIGSYELIPQRSVLMAVVNVTPDSFFSDDECCLVPEQACEKALRFIHEGADLIDLGGESSRPGATPVSVEEELRRILPTVRLIRKQSDIPLSIDTTKSEVARQALEEGANMINDISAGRFDTKILDVVAHAGVPLCLNHLPASTFETMHEKRNYSDLMGNIHLFFEDALARCVSAGITRDQLILDPGIGFGGKIPEENIQVLAHLDRFLDFQLPLLIGTSRKSFIGHLCDLPIEKRLEGTLATYSCARRKGASIFRAHDVAETRRYLDMLDILHAEEQRA